eukprot:362897-Chlamydomonas_euryale.AAC.6
MVACTAACMHGRMHASMHAHMRPHAPWPPAQPCHLTCVSAAVLQPCASPAQSKTRRAAAAVTPPPAAPPHPAQGCCA